MERKLIWKSKRSLIIILVLFTIIRSEAQKLIPIKLPETGQTTSYTATQGEDADIIINPLTFTDNGDGTITDNNTNLMWQKVDGGEMTFENAKLYCNNSVLAGYSDWRLPTAIELFSIQHFNHINPALDTVYFKKSLAEYWWTSEKRADDTTKIWVCNSGGGIGAHPKTETLSAGGNKRFHVRAVRSAISTTFSVPHFTDVGDGTIKDNNTGLVWQKYQSIDSLTWEQALTYASSFSLAGKTDWRIPNIKELQSLNMVIKMNPSFDNTFFTGIHTGNFWSSTSMYNTPAIAWDINTNYGIVSYHNKTVKDYILLVRGGLDISDLFFSEALIPGDTFSMGDHFGFIDPGHPSDETPIHTVKVDSFYMAKTEITNQQYVSFLNSSLLAGLIEVIHDTVYAVGGDDIYCLLYNTASYYSIKYDGTLFSIADFRAYHPVVGSMWFGDAAFCNWLSRQNGLDECYNLTTWNCDFSKNGYRLPTEAEWEWAGRGGHSNPYYNYACGDSIEPTRANLPNSGDPYESTNVSLYPFTTPVGFYNGTLKQKSDYNWPSTASTYQTLDGANGYGLYDIQGNAWELINDWYGQNYYSVSPFDNPTGPTSGFIMPDGKPYRGMRGGNWYNGLVVNGKNDGHSRISNRNPSYYRGPQDPNHPYYHIGFRVARKFDGSLTGIYNNSENSPLGIQLFQNYPNPFGTSTTIQFTLNQAKRVTLSIFNPLGQLIITLVNETLNAGSHSYQWNSNNFPNGIYTCKIQCENQLITKKMILIK
jgi:formylglycine-generating enzyme required for sulfatase activity